MCKVWDFQFALSVAKNELDIESIYQWLIAHSKKIWYTNNNNICLMVENMEKSKKVNEITNVSEESETIIKESINKNKKLLKELSKY